MPNVIGGAPLIIVVGQQHDPVAFAIRHFIRRGRSFRLYRREEGRNSWRHHRFNRRVDGNDSMVLWTSCRKVLSRQASESGQAGIRGCCGGQHGLFLGSGIKSGLISLIEVGHSVARQFDCTLV